MTVEDKQRQINEEIYDILTCLVHSDDHYERGVVDLNANTFLQRLRTLIDSSLTTVTTQDSKEVRTQ